MTFGRMFFQRGSIRLVISAIAICSEGFCTAPLPSSKDEGAQSAQAILLSVMRSVTSASPVASVSFVSFTLSSLSFTQGSSIGSVTPTIGGIPLTSCSSAPNMPTGLAISSTNCSITGTPTVPQAATQYLITASNSVGSGTATITISVSPLSPCQGRGFCYIFITAGTSNGTLGAGGTAGADALCNADVTNKPGGTGPYKAMLVSGSARIASLSANVGDGQVDWALLPSKPYRQNDGTTSIGSTGSNSLFTFPVTNGIAGSGTAWTGLNTNWTSSGNDCGGWLGSGNGSRGNASSNSTTMLLQSSPSCSALSSLYCAEQ